MSGRVLRAGIAGYGYMGEIRRRNIEAHPALALAGVADPRGARGLPTGVPVYDSYQALVGAGLDALFVCTPNHVTPEAIVHAVERGCHVFSEKPPGRCLDDVRRIVAAERRHPEVKLVFGFNHRYHPAITDAKAIVDGGALGRVLTLRGVYGKSGGEGFERSWRNNPDEGGGGILLDQGIHMLDLFRLFCGEFDEVTGMIGSTHWNIPVEDNAMVLLRNGRGQTAQLHSSATAWKHIFRLEIGLEKGYLVMSGLLSKTGSYGRETLLIGRRPARGEQAALGNPREELTYYDTDPSWMTQVERFVECILDDRPVTESTAEDALRVMEIVDRVYRSPSNARFLRGVTS
ncbi:MAG: Gfo/Idh/MocA family oxidoreductase [Acidobacteria bacterium]|nr:Gfo/Idh/MocA family oxidoreductase [Acidobacteriota bacterium]